LHSSSTLTRTQRAGWVGTVSMHCRKFNTGSKRIQNLLTIQSKESDGHMMVRTNLSACFLSGNAQ
jgi:hypothetical protein